MGLMEIRPMGAPNTRMVVEAENERQALLELLAQARQNADQLPILAALLPATFFDDIQRRIETEVDGLHSVKLPVALFLLVRRDAQTLACLDAILARLTDEGQGEGLTNLRARLLDPRNYRQASGALFEVDLLTALLRNAQFGAEPYPSVPGPQQGRSQHRGRRSADLR
jgi:hypothetical protein